MKATAERPKRVGLVLVVSCLMTMLLPAVANVAPTTLNITVLTPAGFPASNADVRVFYDPFNTPDGIGTVVPLSLMASGDTSGSGILSATLDTSMVQTAELGTAVTSSRDAFNVVVGAIDSQTGYGAVDFAVVHQGAWNDPIILRESTDAVVSSGSFSPEFQVIGSGYRYIRGTALNSATGVKATFQYTTTQSNGKQTLIQGAMHYQGSAVFTATGYHLERQNRATISPYIKSGSYHRFVWTNYFWQHRRYVFCGHTGCIVSDPWVPIRFTGTIGDDNPNLGENGQPIGVRTYTQPPLPSDPNKKTALTTSQPWQERINGQEHEYSFTLGVAGFLQLKDISTYGSITKVRWDRLSGCGATRWLYGDNVDFGGAPIVSATCQ